MAKALPFEDTFRKILTVGGMAGAIAIIITVAICGRYLAHGPEEVPQILSNALTTIIGFYFGTSVSAAATKPHAEGQSSN
jgi:hypothetical protein